MFYCLWLSGLSRQLWFYAQKYLAYLLSSLVVILIIQSLYASVFFCTVTVVGVAAIRPPEQMLC